jgi:hypothetical protein
MIESYGDILRRLIQAIIAQHLQMESHAGKEAGFLFP